MSGPPPHPVPSVGQPVASPQATALKSPFLVDLRRRILDGEAGDKYEELDKLWDEILNVSNVAAQKELIRAYGTRLSGSSDPISTRRARAADFLDSGDFQQSLQAAGIPWNRDEMADLYDVRRAHHETRTRKAIAIATIEKNWATHDWRTAFGLTKELSDNMARHLVAFSNHAAWDLAVRMINKVVALRLACLFKGNMNGCSSIIGPQNDDVDLATVALILGFDIPEPSEALLGHLYACLDPDTCTINPRNPDIAKLPSGARLKNITDAAIRSEVEALSKAREQLQQRRRKQKRKKIGTEEEGSQAKRSRPRTAAVEQDADDEDIKASSQENSAQHFDRNSTDAQRKLTLTSTILYPNTAGKRFDLEYYLNSHMPLTEKLWGPQGMTSWAVVRFQPGPDGAAPPCRLKTVTKWESRERLKAAMASEEAGMIYDDVARFTDEAWIEVLGETVGRSLNKV